MRRVLWVFYDTHYLNIKLFLIRLVPGFPNSALVISPMPKDVPVTEAPIRRPLVVLLLIAAIVQYIRFIYAGQSDLGLLIPSRFGLAFNSMALHLLEWRFDVDPRVIGRRTAIRRRPAGVVRPVSSGFRDL